MRSTLLPLLSLPLVLGACVLIVDGDDEGRVTDDRREVISAAGARSIQMDVEAGNLLVRGVRGLDEVRVDGVARASRASVLDDIELHVYRDGDVIRIETEMPGGFSFSNAVLDLVVEVPADLPLRIDDTSGEVEIENTAAVDVRDDSGDLVLTDIDGDVVIGDDSGEIEVEGVSGDLRVREDGSGNIVIADVSGDVLVEEDGSGDIDVSNVDGDLTVQRDGSGRIKYRDIGGRVDVP